MPTTLSRTDRHRAALTRSARTGGTLARLVQSALRHALAGLPEHIGPHDAVRLRQAVEGVASRLGVVLSERLRLALIAHARREHLLTAVELTRASRRGVVREDWTDYARLLIPAPALELLQRIVGYAHERLTRLVDPQRASAVVLQGVAAGKDRKEIATELTRVFKGYEASARRVARTEGGRVACQAQLAASETIPGLVVGYEVYSVLDGRVRPEHAKRHGQRYWRNPKPGQRGLAECPQPPLEADGRLAHNCRCALLPLFADDVDSDTSAVTSA